MKPGQIRSLMSSLSVTIPSPIICPVCINASGLDIQIRHIDQVTVGFTQPANKFIGPLLCRIGHCGSYAPHGESCKSFNLQCWSQTVHNNWPSAPDILWLELLVPCHVMPRCEADRGMHAQGRSLAVRGARHHAVVLFPQSQAFPLISIESWIEAVRLGLAGAWQEKFDYFLRASENCNWILPGPGGGKLPGPASPNIICVSRTR